MHWEIRRKKVEDIDGLRQLYLETRMHAFPWLNGAAFTFDDFDVATQGEEMLVAVSNGKPIGFVSWWLPDNFVHNLYVDPDVHQRGIGKALLAQCLTKLGRPARLKCLQQNTNAVSFYKKLGWQIKSEGISAEGLYFLMSFE